MTSDTSLPILQLVSDSLYGSCFVLRSTVRQKYLCASSHFIIKKNSYIALKCSNNVTLSCLYCRQEWRSCYVTMSSKWIAILLLLCTDAGQTGTSLYTFIGLSYFLGPYLPLISISLFYCPSYFSVLSSLSHSFLIQHLRLLLSLRWLCQIRKGEEVTGVPGVRSCYSHYCNQ